MSKRFSLFYAGFTAYLPARYYRQQLLLTEFKDAIPKLSSEWHKVVARVKDLQPESETYLKVADSIATAFKMNLEKEDKNDYTEWLKQFTGSFEHEFPIQKIDYYYFLFARKLAEIVANVSVVRCCIQLQHMTENNMALHTLIKDNLNDTKQILGHLTACSTLLAGESRQFYFETYYKLLVKQFGQVNQASLTELNEQALNNLDKELEQFYCELMNGFKKCILMLKQIAL